MKTEIHFYHISLNSSQNKKYFRKKICRENRNTHFMLNNFFFFPKIFHFFFQIIWKNFVERGRPQMTIWRMCVACWIPKGYKYPNVLCNIYCFSTATMVARKRLIVSLYIHCLSCSLDQPSFLKQHNQERQARKRNFMSIQPNTRQPYC